MITEAVFMQAGCPSCHPTNSVNALSQINEMSSQIELLNYSIDVEAKK